MPGYFKGRTSPIKGRELPAEVLTQAEVDALLNAECPNAHHEARDRAIVWLIYRHGLKPIQVFKLARRHYEPGSGELVIPATKKMRERTIKLDSVGSRLLDEWFEVRRSLKVRPLAPLFCAIQARALGRPMETKAMRENLRARAERAGIDRRFSMEGLRKSGVEHAKGRSQTVEGRIESYVDDVAFSVRYPLAYRKWEDASDLYTLGATRHATRIGLDCREALMHFAQALADAEGVVLDIPASRTVARLRAVVAVASGRVGETASAFLEALIAYWGSVSDLAQRQTHGAEREGDDLTGEDARRLLFHTLLVMYEFDRALGEQDVRAVAAAA